MVPTRVLLVEDDRADAELIRYNLARTMTPRFEVTGVTSLAQAERALAEGTFDVVLLDLSLPDGHGRKAFRRILDRGPGLPIVLLTHADERDDIVPLLREGAEDHLPKTDCSGELLPRVVRYAIERKRADRRQRDMVDRYRSILATIPDGYYEADRQGRMTLVNEGLRHVFAVPDDRPMPTQVRDYLNPEVYRDAQRLEDELVGGRIDTGRLSWEFEADPGPPRAVEATVSAIRNEYGVVTGFRGIVRDFTDLKRAQEGLLDVNRWLETRVASRTAELERVNRRLEMELVHRRATEDALLNSERMYSNLFEHAHDAVVVHDLAGRVVDMNRRALEQFGYTKDEVATLRMAQLVDRKEWSAFDLPEGRGMSSFHARMQRKTGEWFPAHLRSAAIDVAAKRLIQCVVADRSAHERERAILDVLPDAMFRVRRDGTLLDIRLPREGDRRSHVERFVGRAVGDVGLPELDPHCLDVTARALDSGELQVWEFSHATDRGPRHFEGRIVASGPDEAVVVVRDITEAREVRDALQQARTMAAMGEVVGGVAHEVRNPLFSISATLDAFEARIGRDGGYERYFTVLRESMDRLNELMRDLLEYGKPPTPVDEATPVGDVVEEAVRSAQSMPQAADVTIAIEIATAGLAVRIDRGRLLRVLQNLLQNALQYAPAGGEVRVHVGGSRRRAVIEVADPGPGFSPAALAHAADPFFTERKGGTGLGLAIVHRILDAHDGQITLGNRAEGGGVVRVRLPVAERGVAHE